MIDWFVFVDESGDLGTQGTKFFVVAAVQVKEENELSRIIRKARQRKLKKRLSEAPEIKGFNSNPQVRRFILQRIADADCKIYVLAVEKAKVIPQIKSEPNRLYNWLCRVLCQQVEGTQVKLIFDKKYDHRILRSDFNEYMCRELSRRGITATIEHRESQSCPALQATDFVAWAVNRKYSGGDDSYYRLIENKIANRGKEELWK
ncbi:MAG: DUF3800 domain-containing protein [Candidatus Micrarchaeia archaeon]|jgi:hypothetical protein